MRNLDSELSRLKESQPASTWRSYCKSMKFCFLMSPPRQIRLIMELTAAYL